MVGILRQPPPPHIDRLPDEESADLALVDRARHDRRAFTPLYERYFDAVYRYCYHRLGDWDDAEDAASLVFANALAAVPRFRAESGEPSGSFRSWLFAIAHNVVGNTYRARRPDQPLTAAGNIVDDAPSPEDLVAAAETHDTVRALLAQLPADQRRLLELRLAGLNDVEIARVLGLSHGAVRVAQHRAIVRLRALVKTDHAAKEVRDAAR